MYKIWFISIPFDTADVSEKRGNPLFCCFSEPDLSHSVSSGWNWQSVSGRPSVSGIWKDHRKSRSFTEDGRWTAVFFQSGSSIGTGPRSCKTGVLNFCFSQLLLPDQLWSGLRWLQMPEIICGSARAGCSLLSDLCHQMTDRLSQFDIRKIHFTIYPVCSGFGRQFDVD